MNGGATGVEERPKAVARPRTPVWPEWLRAVGRHHHALGMAGVLLLSLFLNLFRLDQEGFGNLYYAAAVRSMLQSASNFFFAALDPAGFISVDKPPLGFWIQAASARWLGFSGFSLLLPQALAGTASVALLYILVRRMLGSTTGLVAALALAITPISVATGRNNTIDGLLVLTSLVAALLMAMAAERASVRLLLAAAVMVGLGFNIKTLEAYLVLPALYALYFMGAAVPWGKRIAHLALATGVLLAVSFSWVAIVDLSPAAARPIVGSSEDNTERGLIFGYNGLSRLLPVGPAGPLGAASPATGLAEPAAGTPQISQEIGVPGPLRLFEPALAGQLSWLLPLAGIGVLLAALRFRPRWPLDRLSRAAAFWAIWLAPQIVFFSVGNLFHRYYLVMLAPAVAALAGAACVMLWEDFRSQSRRGWLLVPALTGGAAVEARLLADFPEWQVWLVPAVLLLAFAAAAVLADLRHTHAGRLPRWAPVVFAGGMLALIAPPAVWSAIAVWNGPSTSLPAGGPDALLVGPWFPRSPADPARVLAPALPSEQLPDLSGLVSYLRQNRGGRPFLAATLYATTAAQIIVATGEPVMTLGGFTGSDQVLTPERLGQLIETSRVRFE